MKPACHMDNPEKALRGEQGFSLIEVLIAIFILALIAMAFIPLFSGSVARIYRAGYRSQAIFEAAAEVEGRIMERATIDAYTFEFVFDGNTVDVPGGLIEVEQSKNEMESELTAVVPLVPTISIIPSRLVEGYNELELAISGFNTSFISGSVITITGKDGTQRTLTRKNIQNAARATFTLDAGLTNANSPYIVTVTTADEIVKARLQVDLPYFVAVGKDGLAGIVVVSPDGVTWWLSALGFQPLHEIAWSGSQFVAVGEQRTVLTCRNREGWAARNLPASASVHLYGLTWAKSQFVAVGHLSWVTASSNGTAWTERKPATASKLSSIASDGEIFVAVGNSSTFFRSLDGLAWSEGKVSDNQSIDLNDVAWSPGLGLFAAVGNNGTIFTSPTGETWQLVGSLPTTVHLNGIIAGENLLVAVGNNGIILTSSDGINWVRRIFEDKSYHLQAVYVGRPAEAELFVTVGNAGTIFTSPNGVTWTKRAIRNPNNTVNSTTHLYGVNSR